MVCTRQSSVGPLQILSLLIRVQTILNHSQFFFLTNDNIDIQWLRSWHVDPSSTVCKYSYPQWQICQLDCDITSNQGKHYIWLFSREDILSHLLQFLQHEATRSTMTPTPDGWPVQHRVTHLRSSPPQNFSSFQEKNAKTLPELSVTACTFHSESITLYVHMTTISPKLKSWVNGLLSGTHFSGFWLCLCQFIF